MWKLTIEDDEGQRTSLELAQEEYSIGRAEDAAIRLTERNVSRSHATLRRMNGAWQVEDAGSSNGTFVNGARIGDAVTLAAQDLVQLGDYRIELRDEGEKLLRPAEAPVVEAAPGRRPDRLVCVIGPTPGAEYVLEGERLSIGRAEEAGVSINHASVSRFHCELQNMGGGRWEVIDQGSSNGIRINGVELRRGIIEPGDALELGDVRLRFVAAGKFYRPMSDISQSLPVAVPFESMAPAATSGAAVQAQRGVGKIVAVVAVLGAMVAGGWVLFLGPGRVETAPAGTSVPMAATDEEARELLAKALAVYEEDVDKAHEYLKAIGEGSAVRDEPDYAKIEDRWAQHMFEKALATEDAAERRRLYQLVSETLTVSPERRKQASEALLELQPDVRQPPPVAPPPPAAFTAGTVATGPTQPAGTSEVRPPPFGSVKPPPTASATVPPVTTGGRITDPNDLKGRAQATRNQLYGKAVGGGASMGELGQLKAACVQLGDTPCAQMAVGKMRELREKAP